MKNIALFSFLLLISIQVFSDTTNDATEDKLDVKKMVFETLQYGIDSEIVGLLSDLGKSPDEEILKIIIERYKNIRLITAKIDFVKYFTSLKNPPTFIVDTIYSDVSDDNVDKQLKVAIINSFSKIGGEREGRYLLKELDNEDRLISYSAAQSLSEIKVSVLVGDILNRLKNDKSDNLLSSDVKSKLILGLGEMGSDEAIPYLRDIITDTMSDKFHISYGMVSLAKLKDIESIEKIEQNLGHNEPKVQEYSAYALGLFENGSVIPILKRMLLHNNEQVRIHACRGLILNKDFSSIDALSYKFRKDPSNKVKNEALFALLSLDKEGVDELKNILKKQKITPQLLSTMSEQIAKTPTEYSVNYLLELYRDAEQRKDKRSIEAIAKKIIYTESNLVEPIIAILLDSDDYLFRMGGIKAISYIENSALVSKLEDISANDKVPAVKNYAERILLLKKK